MALMMEEEEHPPECGKRLGRRPYWMSPDQYDQCYCGRHLDDADEPRQKYLEARGRT